MAGKLGAHYTCVGLSLKLFARGLSWHWEKISLFRTRSSATFLSWRSCQQLLKRVPPEKSSVRYTTRRGGGSGGGQSARPLFPRFSVSVHRITRAGHDDSWITAPALRRIPVAQGRPRSRPAPRLIAARWLTLLLFFFFFSGAYWRRLASGSEDLCLS